MITISAEAKKMYPELSVGTLLIKSITNTYLNEEMNNASRVLESNLRKQYGSLTRKELNNTEILNGYLLYCKKYTKTYHILLQLESIVLKDKQIPSVSPVVQSMFMGELKNHFLSSVHDYSLVKEPLFVSCSMGTEEFTFFNGEKKALKKEDLYIKDGEGIISAVLYGMGERTKVTEKTTEALYTVYVPFKIEEEKVIAHLEDMAEYLKLNDKNVRIENIRVDK
jgi:DNA/RNA-binding domain of Phe-tRNA-synthetase-like protein